MTYKDLYEKADRKLEKGEISWKDFDEMTKPLDEEIRPHGEWIEQENGIVVCSRCGRIKRDFRACHQSFCNACGADMRMGVE